MVGFSENVVLQVNDLKTVGPFMEIYLQDCIQFLAIMDNNEKFHDLIKDLDVDDVTKKAL